MTLNFTIVFSVVLWHSLRFEEGSHIEIAVAKEMSRHGRITTQVHLQLHPEGQGGQDRNGRQRRDVQPLPDVLHQEGERRLQKVLGKQLPQGAILI